MKKVILFLTLLVSFSMQSQDVRFTVSLQTEPVAYKDGLNFGIATEWQGTTNYFRVRSFVFPGLNGTDYIDLQGTVLGFNIHDKWNSSRVYGGAKVGGIWRGGYGYPTFGFEVGLEYYPLETQKGGIFVGIEWSEDWREDFMYSGGDPDFKGNGIVRIGVTF